VYVNGFVLADNHRGEDWDYEWYSLIFYMALSNTEMMMNKPDNRLSLVAIN